MKTFDITFKDLLQSSRSLSFWLFAFVVPILVTLLFLLMFGGFGGGDEEGFSLPRTSVVIVNLDQGQLTDQAKETINTRNSAQADVSDADSLGEVITGIFKSTVFADIMQVEEDKDEVEARNAVDEGVYDLAIILPVNFTDSLLQSDEPASVTIHKDPTLTIGPAIVESILRQLLDSFSAARIGTETTIEQMAAKGAAIDAGLVQEIIGDISALSSEQTQSMAGGTEDLIVVESISGEDEAGSVVDEMLGLILGGMMVFFAFFTASSGMETILVEEERGTLARLFTTPTEHQKILGGKGSAALITVAVQVTVLMVFGRLALGVDWGQLAVVLLAAVGIILVAAATGLFIVSFLKDTQQTGIVFGGVLTLTGMIGMIGIFTAGIPNQPEFIQTITLLVPQGWAIKGLTTAMDGGTVQDLLPIFGGIMAWTVVFLFIGQRRMRTRFA